MNRVQKEGTNPYKERRKKRRMEKRKPYIIAGLVLAVILFFIYIAVTVSGNNIRSGVSINGLDVSGLTKQQAEKQLGKHLEQASFSVTFGFNGADSEFSSADIVMGYDVKNAVNKAHELGRNKNFVFDFFKTLSLKMHGETIYAEPELNTAMLTEYFDNISKSVKNPIVENSYVVSNNKLKLQNGKRGSAADSEKALKELNDIINSGKNGKIIVLETEKDPIPFDVNKIYDDVAHPAENAGTREENGKKYISEAKNGFDFDKEALNRFINENINNTEPYYFDLTVLKPEITSVNTSAFFKDTLSLYTSKITDSNASRLNNVKLAAEKINGVILNPDEEFRYLAHIEPITTANGYTVANVYSNGKVEQDVGGGVCQVSSALYSAVLYADLEVTRRYNHSLVVHYVPLGQDATVSSGELDFRFRNNTNEPIKIKTTFTYSGITVSILGKKTNPDLKIEIENITKETNKYETIVTEDPTLKPGQVVTDTAGKTGYVIETYKHYYKNGKCVKTDYIGKSRYKTVNCIQRKGPEATEVSSSSVEPTPADAPLTETQPTPKTEQTQSMHN